MHTEKKAKIVKILGDHLFQKLRFAWNNLGAIEVSTPTIITKLTPLLFRWPKAELFAPRDTPSPTQYMAEYITAITTEHMTEHVGILLNGICKRISMTSVGFRSWTDAKDIAHNGRVLQNLFHDYPGRIFILSPMMLTYIETVSDNFLRWPNCGALSHVLTFQNIHGHEILGPTMSRDGNAKGLIWPYGDAKFPVIVIDPDALSVYTSGCLIEDDEGLFYHDAVMAAHFDRIKVFN